jgi:hypothetical protein
MSLLDHAIRHSLRRQVERHRREPRPEVRRRLMQRAAARASVNRWPSLFSELHPSYASGSFSGLDLGWRELAFAQAFRPAGVFGPMTYQLR